MAAYSFPVGKSLYLLHRLTEKSFACRPKFLSQLLEHLNPTNGNKTFVLYEAIRGNSIAKIYPQICRWYGLLIFLSLNFITYRRLVHQRSPFNITKLIYLHRMDSTCLCELIRYLIITNSKVSHVVVKFLLEQMVRSMKPYDVDDSWIIFYEEISEATKIV